MNTKDTGISEMPLRAFIDYLKLVRDDLVESGHQATADDYNEMIARLSSPRKDGRLNFIHLVEVGTYMRLEADDAGYKFLADVFPELTWCGDLVMSMDKAKQIKWAASGYGLEVLVDGDTRW